MHEVVGGGRGEGGLLLLGLGHGSLMVGTSPASAPPAPSPFILGKGGWGGGREGGSTTSSSGLGVIRGDVREQGGRGDA